MGMSGGCGESGDSITIASQGIIDDIIEKYSEHDSECSSVTSDSIPLSSGKHRIMSSRHCSNYKAINEVREDYERMKRKLENLEILPKDVTEMVISLETERYRTERLEEQLNDLTELHQISKMEHLSQQQYVTVEGIDNSNARAVIVKLINVVLTALQVILLLVATVAGIAMPFLRTR
ncbi:transmembrane and coiled-coil domains protein 1-like isoform X2 [Toxorhynchites rutilus septentrionalis]|uniref:transmembrane and coiled-coil domains protein 1-like isoform X2 n=1 Tax=Toxorhynchites rutilus septentrionalis TaxID=329112 RepID=UPI00247AA3D3|nr:transmembrane and coiled-coil domains protein 1-like isoform X2 [Toxorhynchites rutilus septentrionalis]